MSTTLQPTAASVSAPAFAFESTPSAPPARAPKRVPPRPRGGRIRRYAWKAGILAMARNKAATDIDKAALGLSLADLDREKYLEGDYKVELEEKNGEAELARKDLQDSKEKLEAFRKFVKRGFGTPQQLKVKEL